MRWKQRTFWTPSETSPARLRVNRWIWIPDESKNPRRYFSITQTRPGQDEGFYLHRVDRARPGKEKWELIDTYSTFEEARYSAEVEGTLTQFGPSNSNPKRTRAQKKSDGDPNWKGIGNKGLRADLGRNRCYEINRVSFGVGKGKWKLSYHTGLWKDEPEVFGLYRTKTEAKAAAKSDWALRQLMGNLAQNNPKKSELEPPWETLDPDHRSTLAVWGWRLGKPHRDPSYLVQLRRDDHYYLWFIPGYGYEEPPRRSPKFMGHFKTANEAHEAAIWDKKIRFGLGQLGKSNPPKIKELLPSLPLPYKNLDIYDPREESIRAVVRGSGKWAIGVGHYAKKHSAEEIIQRSWERYQQPDQLIRNRQEYERQLGEVRQSGPFRVTLEVTREGLRHFVWPLAARQRVPKPFRHEYEAEEELDRRLRNGFQPRRDLGRRSYTKAELKDWLPPDSIFTGRGKRLSTAGREELLPVPSTKEVIVRGKSLAAKYREYDPNWKSRPRLVARYKRRRDPPKR